MPGPHYHDCCSFVVSFEIGVCKSSHFLLLFEDGFGYFESLVFPNKFQDELFNFWKKNPARILLGVMLNL